MPTHRPPRRLVTAAAAAIALVRLLVGSAAAAAQEADSAAAAGGPVTKPSAGFPDVRTEMAGIRAAAGLTVEPFATEPRVQNPSAFHIDERGRFYVVEANRRRNGVLDMRNLPDWVEEDLASRGVNDRIAMVKRHLSGAALAKLTEREDRVRLIEDRDGDGKADHDTVFADKFNRLEMGAAAGVLAWRGNVFFAEIPDLWLLKDANGDGVADDRRSLHWGFGVHYTYSGHDMHGLRMGPDGKGYWSIADRGARVEKDGHVLLDNPDSGAVFRCDPDGSNIELFATGLRNPQELAFDDYGNLFTGDNNADRGDATRWVYVVEGGDSGWRTTYQYHDFPVTGGPWMAERPWEVNPQLPAAYRIPPIATPKISGPAGLTYYPGTGMPRSFDGRFLLVDFKGGPSNSVIWSLKNRPSGAGFELEEVKEVVTGVLPTDVEFGYAGGFYFTSWVSGWEPKGQGRIYRAFDPQAAADPVVAETRKLMAEGFDQRSPEELAKLLGHADQRVRLEAQYTLADKGATDVLKGIAAANGSQLARIHAMWGLGQGGRKKDAAAALDAILPLLSDSDPEIRAQAARVLGDAKYAPAADGLTKALKDRNARVQYFAAVGVGKLRHKDALPSVLLMLRRNNDRDAFVRHAGIMALAGMADVPALVAAKSDKLPVRRAALLAVRQLQRPEVAEYLGEPEPELVLEAARAINDLPVDAALPALAALAKSPPTLSEPFRTPVLLRALNANYRLGTPEAAAAVTAYAARVDAPDALRAEALHLLATWDKPADRDRVSSLYRPLPPRQPGIAKAALAPTLAGILETAPTPVRVAALNAAGSLGLQTTPLYEIVADLKAPAAYRAASLAAMAQRKDKRTPDAVKLALADADEAVRIAAIRLQPKQPGGVKPLADVLSKGTPREQQAVLQALGAVGAKDKAAKDADALLLAAFQRLEAGTLAPEAHLDLLTAAAGRKSGELAAKAKAYDAARASAVEASPLVAYREALLGGDAARGEVIFRDRQDVSCMRCHAVKGAGGNAGPDLAGLLQRVPPGSSYHHPREYILESIVHPNARIAPGFEAVMVRTTAGDVITGTVKAADDQSLTLDVPNVGPTRVEKATITSRRGGLSAMPEDIAKSLTKHDLRDLVEYLAGQ